MNASLVIHASQPRKQDSLHLYCRFQLRRHDTSSRRKDSLRKLTDEKGKAQFLCTLWCESIRPSLSFKKSKDLYAPSLAKSFVSFLLLFLRFHELTHSCNKSFFLQSSSGKSSQDEGLVYCGNIQNNSKLMLKRKQTTTIMMMAMKMIYYKNDDINDDGHADRDNFVDDNDDNYDDNNNTR